MAVLGKRLNHDKILGLFVVAASMSTGYFFTFLRYSTIDCANGSTHNGGACAVDIIASVFLASISGSGFLGIYYFGPWVVHSKRDNTTLHHYTNLTHLAPEPQDFFNYGFYANASYERAHHQEVNANGKKLISKVWGNSTVGSYEFHLGPLAEASTTSKTARFLSSLTGRSWTCDGYVRIDKHYDNISPPSSSNSEPASTLSLDLVDYLAGHNYDGGCFLLEGTSTGHSALVGFRAGCNAVNVAIPACSATGATVGIGYATLSKAKRSAAAKPNNINWEALCQDAGNAGQVCQCYKDHNITPYTTCERGLCRVCDNDPVTDQCMQPMPSNC